MKKYLKDSLGRIFAHTEVPRNVSGCVEYRSDLEYSFFVEGTATLVPPSKVTT